MAPTMLLVLAALALEVCPPRMPIGIVNVDEPRSFAFTEADQLGSTQALGDTQAFGTGIEAQDCVGRTTNGSHSSSSLLKIGVRRSSNHHSPLHLC